MKTKRCIIPIIFATVALSGCDRKDWRPLTQVDVQVIPYKMGDTIRFVDEKGEPSLCVVDRDILYKDRFSEGFNDVFYEVREVRLVSENSGLDLVLDVAGWRWAYQDKYLRINMVEKYIDFEIGYDSKGNLGNHDSLEINQHVYRDVAVVDSWRGGRLYYNTQYGILQIQEGEKIVFTRIP